jgi:hypothetical protein
MVNLNEDDLLDEDMVNDSKPSNYSFDELQDAYNKLHEKSMIITKELAKTKKEKCVLNDKIDILSRDIIKMRQVQIPFGSVQYECKYCLINTPPTCTLCDDYLKEIDKLKSVIAKGKAPLTRYEYVCIKCKLNKSHTCTSCDSHLKKIDDLNNVLAKFTMGRDNLNILLGKQGCHFKKTGLGYNPSNQQRLYKNFFVSSSTFITCHYCGLKGHSAITCNARKKGVPQGKKVWVPKGTLTKTNSQGPKKPWVPKRRT